MDILAEMEAIVKGAEMEHAKEQAFIMEAFGLTADQARRTIASYEADIARMAAVMGMSLSQYVAVLPTHNAWGILGFHAGQIAAYFHTHENGE